ncbi:MAG: class I SAM-dependent methyltransferase [Actinomycetota bacterium]
MKTHPVFARFYEWLSKACDRSGALEHRKEVAGDARGRVLEIGSGNGLNFTHYGKADFVVAVEPEPNMLRRAAVRTGGAPTTVRLIRGVAEALPFPDGVFDTVVSSLVLCTVIDPARAAAEIRRVLGPSGELRFVEHVRSEQPRAARWQDLANRLWGPFSGGCNVNRDTLATLRAGGFDVEARSFPFGPPSPARPHVLGVARPRRAADRE